MNILNDGEYQMYHQKHDEIIAVDNIAHRPCENSYSRMEIYNINLNKWDALLRGDNDI